MQAVLAALLILASVPTTALAARGDKVINGTKSQIAVTCAFDAELGEYDVFATVDPVLEGTLDRVAFYAKASTKPSALASYLGDGGVIQLLNGSNAYILADQPLIALFLPTLNYVQGVVFDVNGVSLATATARCSSGSLFP